MAAPALRIPISVDLTQFRAAMTEAGQRVHEESEHIEGHFNDINKAAGTLALAFVAAGGAITTALLSTVTSLAKIGDLSDDLRLPVNLLQSLSVAADAARIPAKDLTSALEEFTKVSKQGGDDADKFEKALGNVGASFVKAFENADTQEQRLRIVSNAIKSTTDEVKRAQLSIQAFGSDNERLIALLGGGASAFDAYKERAASLGLAIDEGLVKHAQEAKSQLLLLSRVLSDEFTSAVGGLIPALVRLLPYLNAIALAGQAVSAIFAQDDTASIKQLKDELDGLVDRWSRLKNAQNDLQSGNTAKADTLRDWLRAKLGLEAPLDEEIKSLDTDIAKVQERIDTVKKLIASKSATPPGEKPAFEARDPLIPKTEPRDRFEAAADAIEKRTAALNAETGAIDLGTAAREKAKIAAQLLTVAEQINKEAGENNGRATKEQIETIERFSAAYGRAAAAIEQARSPLATFGRDSANTGKLLNQFAATSLDNMTNALADVVTGTKTAAEAFTAMARSIINDLAKIAIRQAITGPIASALFGAINPFAGLDKGAGPILSPFASGTDYAPGGLSLVGEQGPELVNLPRGSQVIPNNVTRNLGSGSNEINVTLSMDLTGVNGEESMARIASRAAQKAFAAAVSASNAAVPGRQQQYRMLGT